MGQLSHRGRAPVAASGARPRRGRGDEHGAAEGADRVRTRRTRRPGQALAGLGRRRRLDRQLWLGEIGRASCWERVGPYVLISVGAGSLKKKNTNDSMKSSNMNSP